MFILLIVLFLLEIAAFIEIGGEVGVPLTLLWIVVTFIFGINRFKYYTLYMPSRYQTAEKQEQVFHILGGVLAAVLLIIPGFVTDFLGLLLLMPSVRMFLRTFILDSAVGSFTFGFLDTEDLKDLREKYNKKRRNDIPKSVKKDHIVEVDFEVIDPKDDDK